MSSSIQVLSFVLSFFYGILFYLGAKFNNYITYNKNSIFKLIITSIFVLDFVILYVYLMYKINYGIIHPYFLITLILGFGVMSYFYKRICKISVKLIKKLK